MDALRFEICRLAVNRIPTDLWRMERCRGGGDSRRTFFSQHLQAERFASIDPEEFFSFTDHGHRRTTTKMESVRSSGRQRIFVSQQPTLDNDLIIGVGIEPHLKWRTFTSLVMDFIKRCNVYQTFTLGALWADVLYSAPVHFSGSSTDPNSRRVWG